MSVYAGPANWWTDGTDDGRTHIATKGIVQANLVLNLDIGTTLSYSRSGNTLNNLSNTAQTAIGFNNFTYTDNLGGHIILNGTDQDIRQTSILTDAFWQGTWSFAMLVSFSILNAGGTSTDRTLLQHGSSTARKGLHISNRSSSVHFGLYSDDIIASTILSANTWYYVTCTLNNSTRERKIYLNDTLLVTNTAFGAYTGTGSNTRIGGVTLNFGLRLAGNVAAVHVYNRVLTDAEVQQNFNALRGRFGI